MAKCAVTGKKNLFGNSRSHALNANRRQWKVNLQTVRLVDENGKVYKTKVSAHALKSGKLNRA